MKRYYLSPVNFDPARGENVNILADLLAEMNHLARYCSPSPDPSTGRIINGLALCMVDTPLHARLLLNEDIVALPEAALDAKLSSIRTPTLAAMNIALSQRGINTGRWSNSDALFDVVREIGRQIDPTFDPVAFDML